MCRCETSLYSTRMSGAYTTVELGQMRALKYFRSGMGHNRILGLATLLTIYQEQDHGNHAAHPAK